MAPEVQAPMQTEGYRPCECGCGEMTKTPQARFLRAHQFYAKRGTRADYRVDEKTGCWVWAAALTGPGYGQKYDPELKKIVLAHRWYYAQRHGPIPEGLVIDHVCRNRACCNPDHLEAVSMKVNLLRGTSPAAANARAVRCQRGHELAGENLYITPSGKRNCRACRAAAMERYKARMREGKRAA